MATPGSSAQQKQFMTCTIAIYAAPDRCGVTVEFSQGCSVEVIHAGVVASKEAIQALGDYLTPQVYEQGKEGEQEPGMTDVSLAAGI